MLKQTILSTALKSGDYKAINEQVLRHVVERRSLKENYRSMQGDELALPLGPQDLSDCRLVGKVIIDPQGVTYGFIQIARLGVAEGRQYHTWKIEQLIQGNHGNVIFVTYRKPHKRSKLLLTLDEDLRPPGVSVHQGHALLLPHLLQTISEVAK